MSFSLQQLLSPKVVQCKQVLSVGFSRQELNIGRRCKMARKTSGSKDGRVHVISRSDGWAVKKEGNTRASRVVKTKDEAVSTARKVASKALDVVIHKKDGTIQKWEKAEKR